MRIGLLNSGGDCPGLNAVIHGVVGAASMMCAAQAGQRRRSALLIEHYPLLGEKIRIAGGGRCNFTNTGDGPARKQEALAPAEAKCLKRLVGRVGIDPTTNGSMAASDRRPPKATRGQNQP